MRTNISVDNYEYDTTSTDIGLEIKPVNTTLLVCPYCFDKTNIRVNSVITNISTQDGDVSNMDKLKNCIEEIGVDKFHSHTSVVLNTTCQCCAKDITPIEVDKAILPYLYTLNHNGIKTIYSCSGHTSKDEIGNDDLLYEDMYIIIDLNESTYDHIDDFIKNIEESDNSCLTVEMKVTDDYSHLIIEFDKDKFVLPSDTHLKNKIISQAIHDNLYYALKEVEISNQFNIVD